MSSKIINALCLLVLLLLGLFLFGPVSAQNSSAAAVTPDAQAGSNSNIDRDHPAYSSGRLDQTDETKSLACQYLTESDAANIFGKPLVYYTSTTDEGNYKCIYMPQGGFPMGITFEINTFKTVKQAESKVLLMTKEAELLNLQIRIKEFPEARMPIPKPIAGIGQSAYFASSGDNHEFIYFQKGKTFFEIDVLGETGSHFDEKALKMISKKIAENFEAGKN